MVKSPAGLVNMNDHAGEDQHQFTRPTEASKGPVHWICLQNLTNADY
jgi:hypothetical protein